MSNPEAPGTVNNNQATLNDRTGLYIAIIALFSAALSVGLAIRSPAEAAARLSERESRMAQYYIIELDAKLIKLGVELPDGGYQKFKEKRGDK